MMDIIRFKPIPRPAIWGKTKLKDYFNYDDFPVGIGQSWSFSGQKNNGSPVFNAPYLGETLETLWENHPALFHSTKQQFPFIIGLVGPEDSLSVQVHPDQAYADQHGLPSGKNEAWYFIDADEGADLIYGTTKHSRQELEEAVAQDQWDSIVKRRPIHKDDFIYIPAGKLHALQKNVIVYEVQEATDVTYRFYDYHRVDDQGHPRELHLNQAMDCVRFTSDDVTPQPIITKYKNLVHTEFIKNEYFTIEKYEISGSVTLNIDAYQLFSVVLGSLIVNGHKIGLGESFLAPYQMGELSIEGQGILMSTKE